MKVYHASFLRRGSYGARKEVECIAIAETKSEALGQCVMKYTDSDARDWSLAEVDTTKNDVIEVSWYAT
jgi:hypothetical protein